MLGSRFSLDRLTEWIEWRARAVQSWCGQGGGITRPDAAVGSETDIFGRSVQRPLGGHPQLPPRLMLQRPSIRSARRARGGRLALGERDRHLADFRSLRLD